MKAVKNYADKHGGVIDPKKLGDLLSELFPKK